MDLLRRKWANTRLVINRGPTTCQRTCYEPVTSKLLTWIEKGSQCDWCPPFHNIDLGVWLDNCLCTYLYWIHESLISCLFAWRSNISAFVTRVTAWWLVFNFSVPYLQKKFHTPCWLTKKVSGKIISDPLNQFYTDPNVYTIQYPNVYIINSKFI